MPDELNAAVARARSASVDQIQTLLHAAEEEILLALIENPNFAETHASLLLDRLDLSATLLGVVAAQKKWLATESIRLRLARHPRTPRRIALSLLRQLFLFDLVQISLLPSVPAEIRRVAEEIIITRVPHLAVGEKLTLARRGPSRVTGALLAEGHPQAIKLALNNSFLTESQVLKVLAKPGIPPRVVTAISQHPKWAVQYNVRAALLRNAHTPVPSVLAFLPNITLADLKDIARLEALSPHLKKYIQAELSRRLEKAREAT